MSCPPDKELNPKTGRCVKKCPDGQVRNLETMRCVASRKRSTVRRVEEPVVQPVIQPAVTARKTVRRKVQKTPVIQAPIIQPPVIQPPVIQAPVIQAPVIQAPVIQAPVIKPPVAEPIVQVKKPLCSGDQEFNNLTKKCVKKCTDAQERNPKTGRCIKKCPVGQIRNINTMECISGKPETETPSLIDILSNIKKEIEQEKKEEKLINKSTVKIHKFPKDNNDTIVLFIYAHGEIVEKSNFNGNIYWHNHNPSNGCVVMNIEIDNKPLNELVYSLYKKKTNKKDGELHNHVLTKYCERINYEINFNRSISFLIIRLKAYIRLINNNNLLRKEKYEQYQDFFENIYDITTSEEEKEKFGLVMKIIKELEDNYNKIKIAYDKNDPTFKNIQNQWEYMLEVLFIYNLYKNQPKDKPCNSFKRIKKNKIYDFNDPRIGDKMGVFDVYNTKKINPFPQLYEKGTNKMLLGKRFELSYLYESLRKFGYNNIYIYELACNYNPVCAYNTGETQKVDTLARSLSVRTKTATAL